MRRLICAAMFAAGTIAATTAAQANSVKSAFTLCRAMERTGMLSSECNVSGWNQAVRISVAMPASEARLMCRQMPRFLRETGLEFDAPWKLEVRSPYSGNNTIAVCPLY